MNRNIFEPEMSVAGAAPASVAGAASASVAGAGETPPPKQPSTSSTQPHSSSSASSSFSRQTAPRTTPSSHSAPAATTTTNAAASISPEAASRLGGAGTVFDDADADADDDADDAEVVEAAATTSTSGILSASRSEMTTPTPLPSNGLRRSAHSTSSIASSASSSFFNSSFRAKKSSTPSVDFGSLRKNLGSVQRTGALADRGVITSSFKPTRKSSMERLTRKFDQGKIITKKDLNYSKIDPDVTYKVLILGDSSVGKTSLLNALTYIQSGQEQGFSSWASEFGAQSLLPTIGIDFRKVTFLIDNARVQLQIWDTAGQERFRSINKFHYRDAMGILLCYDVTQKETFNNIQSWLDGIDLTEASQTAEDIIIVGNKRDLESQRQVTKEDRKRLKDKSFYPVFEVSAKSGDNVELIFTQLALKIVERCHPKLMTSYLTPEELKQEEEMIAFEERTTRWANPNDLISTPLTRMQRFYPHDVRNARLAPSGAPGATPPSTKDKKKKKTAPAPAAASASAPAPSDVPALPAKTGPRGRQEFEWRRGSATASAAAAATAAKNAVYSPLRDRIGTIKLSAERRRGKEKKCCELL